VVKDLGEDLPVVIFRPSIGECLIVMLPFCLCSSHPMWWWSAYAEHVVIKQYLELNGSLLSSNPHLNFTPHM